MICDCGGILFVIAIEEFPDELTSEEELSYNRVCDVECNKCHKVYYSRSYDGVKTLNLVKETKGIIKD